MSTLKGLESLKRVANCVVSMGAKALCPKDLLATLCPVICCCDKHNELKNAKNHNMKWWCASAMLNGMDARSKGIHTDIPYDLFDNPTTPLVDLDKNLSFISKLKEAFGKVIVKVVKAKEKYTPGRIGIPDISIIKDGKADSVYEVKFDDLNDAKIPDQMRRYRKIDRKIKAPVDRNTCKCDKDNDPDGEQETEESKELWEKASEAFKQSMGFSTIKALANELDPTPFVSLPKQWPECEALAKAHDLPVSEDYDMIWGDLLEEKLGLSSNTASAARLARDALKLKKGKLPKRFPAFNPVPAYGF